MYSPGHWHAESARLLETGEPVGHNQPMSKSDTASKESAGYDAGTASHISSPDPELGHRPAYFVLGRTRDCDYIADLRTRTVHVVADTGERAHRYHLNGKTLDEFVSAVAEA